MIDNERLIGRVIAVESDKVLIKLEDDSKSLTKTFVTGTYPIARINSYVIIPVGSIGIVGIVTKISMAKEDIEFTADASLSLPKPKRTISVSMVGTIQKQKENFKFDFGISQFPVLDNPVWFILEKELDAIFDKDENDDYFIELGFSTAYPDYKVKVNPDKLFSRHLGILGNTGAGKSHTIASILQTILTNKKVIEGKGAHFILFDTNGEYKQAFTGVDSFHCLNIDQAQLRVPYWFMNFQDYRTLFQASEGTQIPILQQAILDAKNKIKILTSSITGLSEFIAGKKQFYQKQKEENREAWALGKINNEIEEKFTLYFGEFAEGAVGELEASEVAQLRHLAAKNPAQQFLAEIKKFRSEKFEELKKEFLKSLALAIIGDEVIDRGRTLFDVDSPHYFSIKNFREEYLEQVLHEAGGSIRDKCSYLLLRMDKFIYDTRYEFIFKDFTENDYSDSLANFLRICFGRIKNLDYEKLKIEDPEYFLNKFKAQGNQNYQVTIFDLSLIPYDILQNVTALLGRLILEFLQRIEKIPEYQQKDVRGKFPVVMVLEEAHNYIPQPKNFDEQSVSRDIFERIAREGRKYGLSLVVSSQRPSELSKTVLSQCNSYIVHRIQNPDDQDYIKKLLPSISQDFLKQLPVLGQGIALVFGDCVRAPMQVSIKTPNPTPRSSDPKYWAHWTNTYDHNEFFFENGEPDFEKICKLWEGGNKV